MRTPTHYENTVTPAPDVVARLVQSHRDFLGFLERRLQNRAQAEDLLQDAFVRGLPKSGGVDPDGAVTWFYQVLRNALIDHARRKGTSAAALQKLSRELGDEHEPAPDTRDAICACVGSLAKTLKPEYAQVIDAVEVEGQSLAAFAEANGITANNAAVRVHRAREALKKQVTAACGTCAEHGCVDCTCGPSTVSHSH